MSILFLNLSTMDFLLPRKIFPHQVHNNHRLLPFCPILPSSFASPPIAFSSSSSSSSSPFSPHPRGGGKSSSLERAAMTFSPRRRCMEEKFAIRQLFLSRKIFKKNHRAAAVLQRSSAPLTLRINSDFNWSILSRLLLHGCERKKLWKIEFFLHCHASFVSYSSFSSLALLRATSLQKLCVCKDQRYPLRLATFLHRRFYIKIFFH